mmetsp:Transcript_41828/g.75943  ORF Transcript_41828/g.75943 Transcript_41828/m.75943 type:complete len:450 (+) Transcript_41828:102-1451(+)
MLTGSAASITVIGRPNITGDNAEISQASEEGAPAPEPPERPGPLVTLWELLSAGLDGLGLVFHRRQLTSRGYRLLRHCVYSGCMALAMLLAIIVDCYLWAGDSGCGSALQMWSIVTSAGVLYSSSFWLLEAFHAILIRHIYGCEPPGPTLRCKGLHHVLCAHVTIIGLGSFLLLAVHLSLGESKVFIISVAVTNALLSTRCIKWMVKVLVELEQASHIAERRAFRDRRPTFAELLEVQFMSNAVQRASHVMQMQQVVPYCVEDFQEHPECCICSRSFDDEEEIRRTLCGHVFHSDCLQRWFVKSHTCPLCRKDLSGGNAAHRAAVTQDIETARPPELIPEGQDLGSTYWHAHHRRFVNVQLNVQLNVQMPPSEDASSWQGQQQEGSLQRGPPLDLNRPHHSPTSPQSAAGEAEVDDVSAEADATSSTSTAYRTPAVEPGNMLSQIDAIA